jgi:hypothetical protein
MFLEERVLDLGDWFGLEDGMDSEKQRGGGRFTILKMAVPLHCYFRN